MIMMMLMICWWWSCRDDLVRVLLVLLSCCRCCACCYRNYVAYGQTIVASIPFYFKRLNFCTLVSVSHPWPDNPTHPPAFIVPRNRKMWFLYPKSRLLPILAPFLPVKQSNMNRFWNSFYSRIASGELYNIAAKSLLPHKLSSMKIIIETFLGDNRFPCVSSVVFQAIAISI